MVACTQSAQEAASLGGLVRRASLNGQLERRIVSACQPCERASTTTAERHDDAWLSPISATVAVEPCLWCANQHTRGKRVHGSGWQGALSSSGAQCGVGFAE